ncbi:MAG: phosphoenolpyruvate--protein phosphotransferase [Candidatus Omnitrophica bacterium]|nr:phosphoenolpyruvate--protein phosphotransferase [Candidatus Omnitrophota bacterium]
MQELKGIAAAAGIAIGRALKLKYEDWIILKQEVKDAEIPFQIQRFEDALIQTRKEILDLQKKITQDLGDDSAQIFEAHLLVLEDRMIIEEVITRLEKEKLCVSYLFSEVLKKYIDVFSKIDDDYIRERIADIRDVGKRLLRHLLGKEKRILFKDIKEPVVVVAHDISPSETAAMYKEKVLAFVTDTGGKTSHTAIMAKSLEIPAVVGLGQASIKINNDDLLIVDGLKGFVIIDPKKDVLDVYQKQRKEFNIVSQKYLNVKDLPSRTLDNFKVKIMANIEMPQEIPAVKLHGAEGIGLYRTEYFYMNREDLPTEEEHYQAYKFVAEQMRPYSVVIRTLDLGGDKFLSQLNIPEDMSRFLGWRAIRFCLARPDIFKVQLRAILRASVHGDLRIMYPMISGIEELRQANAILDECKEELRSSGSSFNHNLKVGAMIEIPSAAMTADILAEEVDFFSIGTNDLIQYTLAVDRANEKVAYLYEPAHPAVLRMVRNIIEAGHKRGILVGMCGEMASDPAMVLVILGLGLDHFSMPSLVAPQIKYIVRNVKMEEARLIAEHALNLSTAKEVESFSEGRLKEILK